MSDPQFPGSGDRGGYPDYGGYSDGSSSDPYAPAQDPYAPAQDPYGQTQGQQDPYGAPTSGTG